MQSFSYNAAFSRNIGWLTVSEQNRLASKRVAIAGLGGVGGSHLLTLTRLGIGRFNLADFDVFELANFNRQAGATMPNLGRPKLEVMAELARNINPGLDLRLFPDGVRHDNLETFLGDADLFLDGLDFFVLAIRRAVFAACHAYGIPAVTAAPLGMGAALLNFLPGRMSFEEYFRLDGKAEDEQLLRFLLGLSPAMLQGAYLVDPSAVDLAAHRGPSTPMACELCAGLAATHVLKILLGRGTVPAAPRGLHFDAYRNRLVATWRPWGNRNPLQQMALAVGRRRFSGDRSSRSNTDHEAPPATPAERILELARWAPSGDNTQPWRFEIISQNHLVVHGRDTRDHCVYDLDGHASHVAIGALLENIAIAASDQGLRTRVRRRTGTPESRPTFDVELHPDSTVAPDPLLPYVRVRTTQRRRMATRRLSRPEREALQAALGGTFEVAWIEGLARRAQTAHLLFRNAGIRLTIPEAYAVHRDVIQWHARFSEDRIPDRAVGLDPVTTRLMQWAMQSWERVTFLNRYLAGTWLPRMELDIMPALSCAAHFVITAKQRPETIDDYVAAGRAVQRFWLTATRLSLQLQPEMTPLIFARYCDNGRRFTTDERAWARALRLAEALGEMIGAEERGRAVFMGRVGAGRAPQTRSTRLSLDRLMVVDDAERGAQGA